MYGQYNQSQQIHVQIRYDHSLRIWFCKKRQTVIFHTDALGAFHGQPEILIQRMAMKSH